MLRGKFADFFFSVRRITQINIKIRLCLEQVFSVIDPEDVKISSAHVPKQILKTLNRQTAKKTTW